MEESAVAGTDYMEFGEVFVQTCEHAVSCEFQLYDIPGTWYSQMISLGYQARPGK